MNTPTPTAADLQRAIDDQEQQLASLNGRFLAAAATPGAPNSATQIATIATLMAATKAGLAALYDAHATATEAERLEAEQLRREASAGRRAALVKKVKQRRSAYVELDKTSEAFVAAVQAFVADGQALRTDAARLCSELHGARAGDHVGNTIAGATCASGATASAMANVIQALVAAMPQLSSFVKLNPFVPANVPSFAQAADNDLRLVQKGLLL